MPAQILVLPPQRLPASGELSCPGKCKTRSFGGKAGEIDGAPVASNTAGE
jgi:hypothetical protein